MRVMVIVKSTPETEAGVMPTEEEMAEMGRFNEELINAGVMLAGEGLHPGARGARVRFAGAQRTVSRGPFEDGSRMAGFWIWQVGSLDEAIAWARRCPNPTGAEGELELRPVFEAEDFGDAYTPELRALEASQRERVQRLAEEGGVSPVPPVAHGATPYLVIRGATDAIDYYRRAFGAELVMRVDAPDGRPMHVEMRVGPAHFMFTEEQLACQALGPLSLGGSPCSVLIHVPDADATVEAAVAAGARIAMPVQDQFWGDRSGEIVDPFGHRWLVATRREALTAEAIQARVQGMFAGEAPPA